MYLKYIKLSIILINKKLIKYLIDAIWVQDFEYFPILEILFDCVWLEITQIQINYIY